VRPIAGIAGDFDGNQFSDLLVAHQGDGVVRLLAGGPNGFTLSDSFSHSELPHPAAIVSVFRGQQIDVYGVNERGNKAVLITALAGSLPAPPALPPLPIAALLFVVAPGVELALGGFNPALLLNPPRSPRELQADLPAGDAAAPLADGSGDEQAQEPPSLDQPPGEGQPDENNEEQEAHDAAIAELLSGVDDALSQHPPQLPALGGGLLPEPAENDFSALDPAQLLDRLPIPPGLAPVLLSLTAAAREWFWTWAIGAAAEAPATCDDEHPGEFEPAQSSVKGGWLIDPRLAAILALSLLREAPPAGAAPSLRPSKRR
jgi:hypothetical protein